MSSTAEHPTVLAVAPYSYGAALALQAKLGVSHVVAQVLVRRGYDTPASAASFLAAADAYAPSAFSGMDDAVALVLAHVENKTPITVHGDYDCDGVCSTALLVRALRELGANVDWYLPDRIADGYGLAVATVARLVARGTKLLITADCAITAVDEVAVARAAGMDVIVSDHHTPRADGQLPDANVVIHPLLCGYPDTQLCATGVVAKIAQALRAGAGLDPDAGRESELELTALATVADVVALTGENRRLVREGLAAMAHTVSPGLRALMEVAQVTPGALDARALAFRLAPRINAAGRLYRPDTALELLLTSDTERAGVLARELDETNAERRHVETRIRFEAEAQVSESGPAPAYVLSGSDWHAGVIGIVAARIAERHNRPAVLIAVGDDEGVGSGRSIAAFDLLGGFQACAEHLTRYGGHRAAAGLQITPNEIDAFRASFVAYAGETLRAEDLVRHERVDAVARGEELDLALAQELASLGPFGAGNPDVTLLLPAATFSDASGFGGEERADHARFSVASGSARLRGVAFGGGARLPVADDTCADATFRLERNEWRGAVEARLVLGHAAPCAPQPITVLGEEPYLANVFTQLGAPLQPPLPLGGRRQLLDERGAGAAATISDLVLSGESVLVVCADVARRLGGLAERVGGFALCSYATLELAPQVADDYRHLVALDAPGSGGDRVRLVTGTSERYSHLVWSAAELPFTEQIHERDYSIRAPLVELFRALRARGECAGHELEQVLRGDGTHPRPAALSGRLLRVLVELGLARVEAATERVAIVDAQRTELERSAAFREYQQRLEDGTKFLQNRAAQAA